MRILSVTSSKKTYGLFKSEKGSGLSLTKYEIQRLSQDLSPIYRIVISHIVKKFEAIYPKSSVNLEFLLRPVLVKLVYFYFERVFRIHLSTKNGNISHIFSSIPIETPIKLEELDQQVKSIEFNQSFIYFVKDIWQLKSIKRGAKDYCKHRKTQTKKRTRNNLFVHKNEGSLKYFLLKQLYKVDKFLPTFNRLPTLTFSNAEPIFISHGLYLTHLKRLNEIWDVEDHKIDIEKRKQLFDSSIFIDPKILEFFEGLGLDSQQIEIAQLKFIDFLILMFPVDFLEGYEVNVKSATRELIHFKRKKLLMSCSLSRSNPLFLVAVAKYMGFEIVNAQHGGYYGYIKDFSTAIEIEWPLNDIFISWGWSAITEKIFCRAHPAILKMPSPWLSERKLYWRDFNFFGNRKYDVLYFPQSMRLITHSPQGLASIRPDVISEVSQAMRDLVRKCAQNRVSIFCKPYDYISMDLMRDTFECLNEDGLGYFTIAKDFHKGLDYEILSHAKIVLWDQIGTGFWECLACGIPSLVILHVKYAEIESSFKPHLELLASLGIVHFGKGSLIKELTLFKMSPIDWVERLNKNDDLNDIISNYANTDNQWCKVWKAYFKSI